MREILFRIYDKVSERMIYSCDCDEELQGKREFMPFMFPKRRNNSIWLFVVRWYVPLGYT